MEIADLLVISILKEAPVEIANPLVISILKKSTSGNSRTFGEPDMMMQMIREIREMNRNLQSFLPFQRS